MFQKYKSQARFLVVGGSSTLLDFIIYMLLSTKLNITISKFISMTVSSIYSFLINKNWTFNNKNKICPSLVKDTFEKVINILNEYGYEL